MNVFDEIEAYVTQKVQVIDANLEFFPDIFGEEDINNHLATKKFKFYFGTTSFEKSGNERREFINSTLEIYARRVRDPNQDFKDLYCKALDIKNEIVNPQAVALLSEITDVQADLVEPLPLDTDDNTIRIVLNLIFRRDIIFN